ncbi:hypothetical protein BSKO_04125 [Bryopsis sp. KO-2023]|nr:hypothetical protein BSKO_04125 [Bryopsis sp. KO-2023]
MSVEDKQIIEALAKRIEDLAEEVVTQAAVFLTESRNKVRDLGKGEPSRAAACVQLACDACGVVADKKKIRRHGCVDEKTYYRGLARLQKSLGVLQDVDVTEMAKKFGCVRHSKVAIRTLDAYKTQFLKGLGTRDQQSANFNRPVFSVVAFYLVAVKNRAKVDRQELAQCYGIDEVEFDEVAKSMRDLCYNTVGISKTKRPAEEIKTNNTLLGRHRAQKRPLEETTEKKDSFETLREMGSAKQIPHSGKRLKQMTLPFKKLEK